MGLKHIKYNKNATRENKTTNSKNKWCFVVDLPRFPPGKDDDERTIGEV